jgi:hypothetical protein
VNLIAAAGEQLSVRFVRADRRPFYAVSGAVPIVVPTNKSSAID